MSEHHSIGVTRRDVLIGRGRRACACGDRAARGGAQALKGRDRLGRSCSRTGTARAWRAPPIRVSRASLVSNGRDVAVTGADGRYTLPLPDEATIFVVKPAGFMPPLEPATNLPRFYRHYQPKGSPPELNLTFEGLAPTGPLPASVDFALRRQDEPNAFDVVMVTDPQPETGAEVDFIREDLIQALAGVDAKFGLTAGDIMFDDLSLYPRSNAIMGAIGLPWWNIGGNHDLNFEAPDRRYSRETFKRVFGPNYYAFFYAKTLFLMLDDVNYLGPDPAKPRGAGKYEGRLDEAQLDVRAQRAGAYAGRHADRRRDAHSDPHLSRRRALSEPAGQGGVLRVSSKGAGSPSASPATPIRPSTIISTPPTAGRARRRTTSTY